MKAFLNPATLSAIACFRRGMGFLASSAADGSNHSGGSTQAADGVVISQRQYFVAVSVTAMVCSHWAVNW